MILRRRKMADLGFTQRRSACPATGALIGRTTARSARNGGSIVSVTRVASLACACVLALILGACASPEPRVLFNDSLRQELLRMAEADQRIRADALRATNFHGVLEVDARHLHRLKQIVEQHGW